MSRAERTLLTYRLREMIETHERLAFVDDHADTADTLEIAIAREEALCAGLLREAVVALEAAI